MPGRVAIIRAWAGVVAGVLVTAAATLAVPLTPASAATCGGGAGVSVVVDFHQLGNGIRAVCDPGDGGAVAAKLFTGSGFTLTYEQRQPGFVCQVDGGPPGDPCVNTPPPNAYWSLWWSDGTSGTWKYSTLGVGSLTVPAGGSVALSWQGGSDQAPPRVKPPVHASSPTSGPTNSPSPTQTPTASSSSTATATPVPTTPTTSPAGSPVATPLHPTKTPTAGHTKGHGPPPVPVGSPSASPTQGSASGGSSDGSSGGGLPGWLAPVLIAVLFVAAGVVAVVRRNRAGGR